MIALLILMTTTGCSSINGKNDFIVSINQIKDAANASDWVALEKLGKEIRTQYHNNKWKIQLIGDEGEYEGLEEYINQLVTAIELQSKEETKLALAGIQTLIEDIYSL